MASNQPPFAAMTTSRDTPNPLRPYYVPPSIGGLPRTTTSAAAAANNASISGFGRSARDLLSDFDYAGPLLDKDGASFTELGRNVFDQAVWKYTSVLLAQPFDVAKTILQIRLAGSDDLTNTDKQSASPLSDKVEDEDESDQDDPSYFTPTRPPKLSRHDDQDSPVQRRVRRRGRDTTPVPASHSHSHSSARQPPHRLVIHKPDSVLEALSQLWQHSGATGLWKATNATFVYNVLAKAMESWTRSLLSALLNLPDPTSLVGGPSDMVASAMGAINIADSPSPLISLAVAVAAAGITGVLLSPLDLVRTRLIITPTTSTPRAILPSLRILPSFISPTLLPVTLLHSSLPTLVTSSAPLLLRHHLGITPWTTPSLYSLSSFCISSAELFLKLPLETVLRRCQVHVLRKHGQVSTTLKAKDKTLDAIVDVGPYKGIAGTMWSIVRLEGATLNRQSGAASSDRQKPAGIPGLFRGWKVGMWGLVGVWGASALGNGGRGVAEF